MGGLRKRTLALKIFLAPSGEAEDRHPEGKRGMEERFLPDFILSLAEGVEMTINFLCVFAGDTPSFVAAMLP